MTNIINYEDDIFYLTHIVKKLADGIRLEIDPQTFKERIAGELLFVNACTEQIFASLKQSQLKINRDTILKNMLRLNRHFIRLLDDIIHKNSPFAIHLQDHREKLLSMRNQHREFIQEIEDLLSAIYKKGNGDQETISEEEMRILLTNPEDDLPEI
jgi:hypothetical protein